MIKDAETDFVYLAGCLRGRCNDFCERFEKLLSTLQIPYAFLPLTKDLWAVDYMPIQVSEEKFVQFIYNPDYLRNFKGWSETISDTAKICEEISIETVKSDLVIDGGNVIKSKGTVLMCDKVFSENPHWSPAKLRKQLENDFETDTIIFIPTDPLDEIGHADGMVRFIDEGTVLINDYSKEDRELKERLEGILKQAGLSCVNIPYSPYQNKTYLSAEGIYINYLQVKDRVVIATYNRKEDGEVVKLFEDIFKQTQIATIECGEIARHGGVLNCITWNIKNDGKKTSK